MHLEMLLVTKLSIPSHANESIAIILPQSAASTHKSVSRLEIRILPAIMIPR